MLSKREEPINQNVRYEIKNPAKLFRHLSPSVKILKKPPLSEFKIIFLRKEERTMKQSDDSKFIPMTAITGGSETSATDDIHYLTDQIVNVIFVGNKNTKNWILIDTGMPKSYKNVIEVAEKRFGKGSKPSAILLTHGHFDHVGGIVDLIKEWNVPVFAHPLEMPFLTGKEKYPEPDPTVEGGMLAKISSVYPNDPIDISEVIQELPEDHSVPFLQDWKWIHTPGHSAGHVSFFRAKDKSLIVGDAFITVRQDSFYRVLVQKQELNGPPRYLTPDWKAAKASVEKLEALKPEVAVAGHGPFMRGEDLRQGLEDLVFHFEEKAVPDYGKYVNQKSNKS